MSKLFLVGLGPGSREQMTLQALEALEEDGFFELECPNCGDTLVVDKSVLDSGSVTCPGCGQEFEIELGYEDEDDQDDPEE